MLLTSIRYRITAVRSVTWLKKLLSSCGWMNATDAQNRGIKDGVLCASNDKGVAAIPAYVTSRLLPGWLSFATALVKPDKGWTGLYAECFLSDRRVRNGAVVLGKVRNTRSEKAWQNRSVLQEVGRQLIRLQEGSTKKRPGRQKHYWDNVLLCAEECRAFRLSLKLRSRRTEERFGPT